MRRIDEEGRPMTIDLRDMLPTTTLDPGVTEQSFAPLQEGRYRVRLARDREEIEALQRLRFEVFNRELGEGLASAWESGRDEDAFDTSCHHLLVEEIASGRPVGTYRLQTAAMAARHRGLYAAGEFDLSAMPAEVLEGAVEVGRACVAADHRNTRVLFLLWKGLARYVATFQLRYLFGCSSVTSQDPAVGRALHAKLVADGRLHPTVRVTPLPHVSCNGSACDGECVAAEVPELPPLFRIYLRHGAWICGEPAIDREFGTIDFLVLLDVAAMDPAKFQTFFG
jgi:putative hemolysin